MTLDDALVNGTLGEALGDAAFEDAIAEPIDIEPVDGDQDETPPAAKELAKLIIASPEKKDIKEGDATARLAAIQRLSKPDANPDALNNLGCAWALLALSEERLDYWPRATEMLGKSEKHEDATPDQKKRAQKNLNHVQKAREDLSA